MTKVIVVAPHPDDETLGCGGTLLRAREEGDEIFWIIVTDAHERLGFNKDWIEKRKSEILQVQEAYGFTHVFELNFETTALDMVPSRDLISEISRVFETVKPDTVYVPFRGDVHSDHKIVFDATIASSKWFRAPFIKNMYAYETLSETEMNVPIGRETFQPNRFVNISKYNERKLEIMHMFESECGTFPFPRSSEAIDALEKYRGSMSGHTAAEAFMILREILD